MKVRRALVSVHDKTGVVEFARGLALLGIEILSTGGTAKLLRESGVSVRDVADVTGFPEMLDGRVKTLHPKIHGGILARRDTPGHLDALEKHGIPPIDLVVVALYPFEATVARVGAAPAEAIEQIDVGGPAMIRAGAKNHASVGVVTDPSQYPIVLDELRAGGGALSEATRARLAREAFRRTARYDAAIAAYLSEGPSDRRAPPSGAPSETGGSAPERERTPRIGSAGEAGGRTEIFPTRLGLDFERMLELRYGENPHQAAAFYAPADGPRSGVAAMKQLHGPEPGYNNLLDFSAALGLVLEFDEPAAVVIKHTNPCGVALGATVGEAMTRAKACDPVSIYGGIVGVNRALDMDVVEALAGIFVEILFAPAFVPDALAELRRTKKKCRVFEVPCERASLPGRLTEYRSVLGGLLAQSADLTDLEATALRTVSKRRPTTAETDALCFAWRVAKHVKSNAIVLATRGQVVGIGAGQMNRVDSARLAVMRAREVGLETTGTACASDAFFPFRDGLDVVAKAGATAAIHPGGSLRDDEVVAAADEYGMAMVVTGIRHFRH
jgi:phosphoribosylaminoimidazolecarboxamide formyltransferase / IMP cyclohydrolase